MNIVVANTPMVYLTSLVGGALIVVLILAVIRTVEAPARRKGFDEALGLIMSSELEADTALNQSTRERRTWFEYWNALVQNSGRTLNSPNSAGITAALTGFFGAMFGFLVLPGGVPGLIVAPIVILVLFRWLLVRETAKRQRAMEKQLPLLLSSLRHHINIGKTPQMSMLEVADEMPAPLGDEMRLLKRDLNVNVSLEVALDDLASRVPSREMQFLVSSIEIAVRSGADLDPQLVTIERIVKQRIRLRGKMRAAMADVAPTRMTAVFSVPLGAAYSLLAGDRDFWFSLTGLIAALAGGLLYALGIAVMSLMVRGVERR